MKGISKGLSRIIELATFSFRGFNRARIIELINPGFDSLSSTRTWNSVIDIVQLRFAPTRTLAPGFPGSEFDDLDLEVQ